MAVRRGTNDTNFCEAAPAKRPPGRSMQTSDEVVDAAFKGLERGQSHIISGWSNYLLAQSERLVPRSLVARLIGRVMRPRHSVET